MPRMSSIGVAIDRANSAAFAGATLLQARGNIDEAGLQGGEGVGEVERGSGDLHGAGGAAGGGDEALGGEEVVREEQNVAALADGRVRADEAVIEDDETGIDENVATGSAARA